LGKKSKPATYIFQTVQRKKVTRRSLTGGCVWGGGGGGGETWYFEEVERLILPTKE